ncbi:hypothetical protein LZ31DRAFT_551506 [Colletotrichum somersetense]|nr:hypothetical protein LZ31DRAFT_551506 [Colletotrichum somersetense]
MRLRCFAFSLLLTSGLVLAAPRPRGEALPLVLIPRMPKNVPNTARSSNERFASTGRPCGTAVEEGVCYNGKCGTFVAPTGFQAIPETESQCLDLNTT